MTPRVTLWIKERQPLRGNATESKSASRRQPDSRALATDTGMGDMNLAIGLEGLWIIDADASTVYANSAMCEILGTEASDMPGAPSFDYIFPEDMDAARELFESKQRGGMSPFHFRLRRKDGSEVWVDVQGTPMHGETGEFLGIVGTFRVAAENTSSAEPRKSA
jgi:PAS domain S-box-containing protein